VERCSSCPSEYSAWLLERGRYRPRTFLQVKLLVQSHGPLRYRRYRLGDPTVPLGLPSAMWSSLCGRRRPHLSDTTKSTHRAWLPCKHYPARPEPVGRNRQTPLMGFASLQHLQDPKVHSPRALPARYVPPSGFGYPLDGLLPSDPGRSCFVPAAPMGFPLRSVLLTEGDPAVSGGMNPRTVSLAGIPSTRK